ncbi:MAG: DNA double-strand break repair protein Mre11, partial [Cyanobacteria bacterium P01_A01_bin.70]
QKSRSRLPELTPGNSLDPLEALQTYLNNREDLAELATDMVAAAQALIADAPVELETASPQPKADEGAPREADLEDEALRQLRLL